jgi:hypothetical protein
MPAAAFSSKQFDSDPTRIVDSVQQYGLRMLLKIFVHSLACALPMPIVIQYQDAALTYQREKMQ